MKALTKQQRAVLVALADGAMVDRGYLGRLIETSQEGAARTASSLVRRGLARRLRSTSGRVLYKITATGIEALRHEQLELG